MIEITFCNYIGNIDKYTVVANFPFKTFVICQVLGDVKLVSRQGVLDVNVSILVEN